MAKGGRQPTPNLRVITRPTGSKVKDRSRAHRATGGSPVVEEPLDGEVPEAPDYLRVGTVGRRYWRHYWKTANWLTKADVPAVSRLCRLWNLSERIMDAVEEDGLVGGGSEHEPGKARLAHPLLNDYDRLIGRIERLEDRLGLNPVERSRIRIQVKEKKSSLDTWREGRPAAPASG